MKTDETVTETTKTNAEQLSQIRIMNANNAGEITISARSQTPREELREVLRVSPRVLWRESTEG